MLLFLLFLFFTVNLLLQLYCNEKVKQSCIFLFFRNLLLQLMRKRLWMQRSCY